MKKIWILTTVKRGFIQEPEIFYNSNAAQNRKKILMQDVNPDYDEIGFRRNYIAPLFAALLHKTNGRKQS